MPLAPRQLLVRRAGNICSWPDEELFDRFGPHPVTEDKVMTNTLPETLVAVYPSRSQAEAAVSELWHLGFPKDSIGLAAPGEKLHQATTATEPVEEGAAKGAIIGAVAGSAVGAAAGAVALTAFPWLGAILIGGNLMGIAGSTAAGAALGTYAGPFVAMGLTESAAKHYGEHLQAGRSVVVVYPGRRHEEAASVLKSHDPYLVSDSP